MTYDLRRLRLRGLIRRIPGKHRYQVTTQGLRIALFFTRIHARLLRPELADIFDPAPRLRTPLRKAFDRVDQEIKRCCLNSTSMPENLTRLHQIVESKVI